MRERPIARAHAKHPLARVARVLLHGQLARESDSLRPDAGQAGLLDGLKERGGGHGDPSSTKSARAKIHGMGSVRILVLLALLASRPAIAGVVDYVANPPIRGLEHQAALLDLKSCLAAPECPEAEKKLTRRLLALIDPPPGTEEAAR